MHGRTASTARWKMQARPSAAVHTTATGFADIREKTLAEVAGKRISCSGTTVADHAGMLRYLETMTDRLVPYTPGERMAGYDQGVHNVLLHDGSLPGLTLHDNSGPILTLASTKGEPDTDEAGYVLNDNGKRAHIVHQYDRKPDLFKMIRQRYA